MLWTPKEKPAAPALWHREGYWSPLNAHFRFGFTDEPWTGDGHHLAIDLECMISGIISIAPRTAPVFDQFPRDQPTPEIDPISSPTAKRGYAACCSVLDDPAIDREAVVISGNNWSWTEFIEQQYNRTTRHFGQGMVPVFGLMAARPIELKNGGTTSVIRASLAGWIRRPPDMIEFAESRGTIDSADPPALISVDPQPHLAFTGAAARLAPPAASLPAPEPPPCDYAKAKTGGETRSRPPPQPPPRSRTTGLDDDDIPF
jgi:hypothetical protein